MKSELVYAKETICDAHGRTARDKNVKNHYQKVYK